MTQENKELLLKDLCARLPYGVKVEYNSVACEVLSIDKYNEELTIRICPGYTPAVYLVDVKPYLLPQSSMTEEATGEFYATLEWIKARGYSTSVMTCDSFDCLNKHHIDYRGLIPMGLANDATGLNIY